jgi:phage terminase Nu1 subunit (DNA packaging protein)
MTAPVLLLTRRALAALPDLPGQAGPVHMMTVTKWERSGMPVAERGRKGKPSRYSEVDVRAWLQAREAAVTAGTVIDVINARARKELAQARLAEQKHETLSRVLLPRAEVERVWAMEVAAVRQKLLSLPTTVADRILRAATLDGLAGVERVLDEVVKDTLRELSGVKTAEQPKKKKQATA